MEVSDTKDESVLHALDYDLRTSAFIVREGETAELRFAHKSFLECFAAKWVLRSLATHRPDCLRHVYEDGKYVFDEGVDRFLREAELPAGVLDFLKELKQGKNGRAAKRLLKLLEDS